MFEVFRALSRIISKAMQPSKSNILFVIQRKNAVSHQSMGFNMFQSTWMTGQISTFLLPPNDAVSFRGCTLTERSSHHAALARCPLVGVPYRIISFKTMNFPLEEVSD